jgi:nitrate/nitrite transporter NarK
VLVSLVYGANLFFGIVGDYFGWRRTVTFFGCIGCAIATPLWFFGSLLTESYAVTVVLGMLYGVLLAGFVPLSALMPSMVEHHDKGAALAILNTGAGGAAFIGLAIPTALAPLIGYGGGRHNLRRPLPGERRADLVHRLSGRPRGGRRDGGRRRPHHRLGAPDGPRTRRAVAVMVSP